MLGSLCVYKNCNLNYHKCIGLKVVKVDLKSSDIISMRMNVWLGSMGIKYPHTQDKLTKRLEKEDFKIKIKTK